MVSIGLPVVKHHFFSQSIESCLQQTFHNFELIIVNNAKDSVEREKIHRIVQEHQYDQRIRYFCNQEQLPVIENWNYVLSLANREFFILLSDDDYFDPDYIQKLLELSKQYPGTHTFYGRTIKVDKNDNPFILGITAPNHEDVLDFIFFQLTSHRTIVLSSFLVRTDLLNQIGGFTALPDGWGSDVITWFKMASIGGVAFSTETKFYYRYNPFNISSTMQIHNQRISMDMYYKEVISLVNNYEVNNSFDKLKHKLITHELEKWYLRNKTAMFIKKLRRLKLVPNVSIPFIALFYDSINKVIGPKP